MANETKKMTITRWFVDTRDAASGARINGTANYSRSGYASVEEFQREHARRFPKDAVTYTRLGAVVFGDNYAGILTVDEIEVG